jgi:hypothetical protein
LRSLPFLLFREKNKPAGEAEHVAEVGGGSSIPSPHFRRAADRQAAGIEQETAGSQRSPENNR